MAPGKRWSRIFKGAFVKDYLDAIYPLRTDVETNATPSRFRPRVKKRLSEASWRKSFDSEGRLTELSSVLRHIVRGGVEPSIRDQVWPFLLGVYPIDSTAQDREEAREANRDVYRMLKQQANEADPIVGSGIVATFPRVNDDGSTAALPANYEGPMRELLLAEAAMAGGGGGRGGGGKELNERITRFRKSLHQIGVDVMRADRCLQFFEEEGNRARLMDILAVYSWMDPEVGYCQGMSDLASPMVVLFPDNAEAFRCFVCLMKRVRLDFVGSSQAIGIQREIDHMVFALNLLDPELLQRFDDLGAGSLFFTVRTLMAMFRRELSFADTLYLWEMMWAMDFDSEDALDLQEAAALLQSNVQLKNDAKEQTDEISSVEPIAEERDLNLEEELQGELPIGSTENPTSAEASLSPAPELKPSHPPTTPPHLSPFLPSHAASSPRSANRALRVSQSSNAISHSPLHPTSAAESPLPPSSPQPASRHQSPAPRTPEKSLVTPEKIHAVMNGSRDPVRMRSSPSIGPYRKDTRRFLSHSVSGRRLAPDRSVLSIQIPPMVTESGNLTPAGGPFPVAHSLPSTPHVPDRGYAKNPRMMRLKSMPKQAREGAVKGAAEEAGKQVMSKSKSLRQRSFNKSGSFRGVHFQVKHHRRQKEEREEEERERQRVKRLLEMEEEARRNLGQERMVTFCVLALLVSNRERFLGGPDAFEDVVKEFNNLTEKIKIKQMCKAARGLHKTYLHFMKASLPRA